MNYKHFLELWLETLHETSTSRRPAARRSSAACCSRNRHLGTCFSNNQAGKVAVTSSDSSVSPLVRVPIDLGDIDVGGVKRVFDFTRNVRTRAFETVTLERSSTRSPVCSSSAASSRRIPSASTIRPSLASLDRWSKLPAGDARNLGFDEAADLLKLSDAQQEAQAGGRDRPAHHRAGAGSRPHGGAPRTCAG